MNFKKISKDQLLVFENLTLRLLCDWLDKSVSSLLVFVQIGTQIGLSEVFHVACYNTDLLAGDKPPAFANKVCDAMCSKSSFRHLNFLLSPSFSNQQLVTISLVH